MRHHYWEWPIATYLFLGGMGGGMFFLAMVLQLIVFPGAADMVGAVLCVPIFFALAWLALGCFFLVFELGQPGVFLYVFFNSTKSVIGHGARILCVSLIFGLFWWLSYLPWDFLAPLTGFLAIFRTFNIVLAGVAGFCIMLYTGILFSSLKAHSFWATPALPVLFTVSALSTACACIMLTMGITLLWPVDAAGPAGIAYWLLDNEMHELLHTTDIILILVEITVLLLLVLSLLGAGNKVAHDCAARWVYGSWKYLFWLGMVCCGLAIPLVLNLANLGTPAAVLALCGGLLLRFLIVYSDDRAEVPGETRYFTRLQKAGTPFMTKWDNIENIF